MPRADRQAERRRAHSRRLAGDICFSIGGERPHSAEMSAPRWRDVAAPASRFAGEALPRVHEWKCWRGRLAPSPHWPRVTVPTACAAEGSPSQGFSLLDLFGWPDFTGFSNLRNPRYDKRRISSDGIWACARVLPIAVRWTSAMSGPRTVIQVIAESQASS